jgi:ribosome-binding protein aMBF1 (putative translation factor)
MSMQDWEPITISGKSPVKGSSGGTSKPKFTSSAEELRKVDSAEGGKPKMLTQTSRSAMASARVAKGLTQKQLDQQGCFPANSTNAWESGRLCPTSQQVQILNRILSIKLERA